MTPPHRYHLVIGPPCSGKTTVAQCLVARLQKRGERARFLTPVFDRLFDHSDRDTANVLRREDDWAFQLESLIEAESRGVEDPGEITWVFAANACTPQLRLQYPLHVQKAGPVAWIAWWLHTTLATCHRWNSRRPTAWPWRQEVIAELHALLNNADLRPSIEDGFAGLQELNPACFSGRPGGRALQQAIDAALDQIEAESTQAPPTAKKLKLHAYSCPGDFERLMQGLVRAIWNEPHTFANHWLEPLDGSGFALAEDRDFCQLHGLWPRQPPGEGQEAGAIKAPPVRQTTLNHRGGWHRLSDARRFSAVMGELRDYLHHPTPGQRSRDLQDIIDSYGLSRGEQRLTIEGENLENLKTHILYSRIYVQNMAIEHSRQQPMSLHLLGNPYGMAIKAHNTDGSVMEGDSNCYLGMLPATNRRKSARVYVVLADPRKPKQPLHYSISPPDPEPAQPRCTY